MDTTIKHFIITFRRIAHLNLAVAIAVLLPVALFLLVTSKTNAFYGFQSFVVLTGSMSPSINPGSVVLTRPEAQYVPGDVISFEKNDRVITHRISDIEVIGGQAYFVTQGDANNTTDAELVMPSEIVGRSFLSVPYVGSLVLTLREPIGFIGFVIVPGILFIFFEALKIRREIIIETEKKIMSRLTQQV